MRIPKSDAWSNKKNIHLNHEVILYVNVQLHVPPGSMQEKCITLEDSITVHAFPKKKKDESVNFYIKCFWYSNTFQRETKENIILIKRNQKFKYDALKNIDKKKRCYLWSDCLKIHQDCWC